MFSDTTLCREGKIIKHGYHAFHYRPGTQLAEPGVKSYRPRPVTFDLGSNDITTDYCITIIS